MYLSEVIGNEYKSWNNEKIILDCGTGRGKTTFILKHLCINAYKESKTVLFLCNRTKLKEQIEKGVDSYNLTNVTVMTYQKMQNDILTNNFSYIDYDYVIADEVHYIFGDANFNLYTDIALEYLLGQKDNVVVFMSATAKSLFGYLKKNSIVNESRIYTVDTNYDYVDKVYLYNYEDLTDIINEILSTSIDEKILIFINSEKQMLAMNEVYKDKAHYYCSASTKSKELKKIREENCVNIIDEDNITFENRILFTTTALDNGIDFKDEKIKHIISEVFEPDSAIQCLGRKRKKNDDDKCTFYIANYKESQVLKFQKINEMQLEPLNLFIFDKDEYITKYGIKRERRYYNEFIYNDWNNNGIPKLNSTGHIKLVLLKVDIMGMQNLGYAKNMFACHRSDELAKKVIMKSARKLQDRELEEHLAIVISQYLFESDQLYLKEEFRRAGFKGGSIGLKTMNKFLELNNYSYNITSERTGHKSGDSTVWIVNKL